MQALDFADLRYPYPTRFADLPEGKVAYVVDGPESPRGTIVLLHGWLGDLRGWAAVMPFLARDYRVVALDFPGYGKSDKSRDRAYGVPLFADATHHLLASLGVERATWMGHSLGGQVAAYAA
ncbi:MAG: alpha/beta fold hydrolase, partial [Myxococcales bacterium]|nr:alpha/beta fold hydrolase [Myxococcales bacterium]